MASAARKRARVEEGADASSQVADIFLLHGGLRHFPTDDLLSTFGCVSRQFQKQARGAFNARLRRRHPSLVAAVGSDNINRIRWREWRRFEMGEGRSEKSGKHRLRVAPANLLDYDILLEVGKKEGDDETVIWHGVEHLTREDGYDFTLPHVSFDAPKPAEGDRFFRADDRPDFPGRQVPRFWWGQRDCSLQQKSLCKALYGIRCPRLLHVHVVLRRRSDGKMMTVLSDNTPTQILGEDYGENVGNYEVDYGGKCSLFEEGAMNLCAMVSFKLFCSEKVDTQSTIQFTSRFKKEDVSSSEEDSSSSEAEELRNSKVVEPEHDSDGGETGANVNFRFFVMDNEEGGQEDYDHCFLVRAMQAWKWD